MPPVAAYPLLTPSPVLATSAAPSHGTPRTRSQTCAAAAAPPPAARTGETSGRPSHRTRVLARTRRGWPTRRRRAARRDTSDCERGGTGRALRAAPADPSAQSDEIGRAHV